MIGLGFLGALFIGIPALVYVSEHLRRRRTRAELEDEAVRLAQHGSECPGDHEPLGPTLPNLPPPSGF